MCPHCPAILIFTSPTLAGIASGTCLGGVLRSQHGIMIHSLSFLFQWFLNLDRLRLGQAEQGLGMAESLPLLLPIFPPGSGLLGGLCSSWCIPTLQTAKLFVCGCHSVKGAA